MKTICVYLGANSGKSPLILDAVKTLGQEIADQGYTLIYGGSSCGMMGVLANTVKENGGCVIGIITKKIMEIEEPQKNIDELIIVDTMQQRKLLMQEKADAFMVVPGGLGTLEEAIETWNGIKIGTINKPIGFLNVEGYFDGLFSFLKNCSSAGFLKEEHVALPLVSSNPVSLIISINEECEGKLVSHKADKFERALSV